MSKSAPHILCFAPYTDWSIHSARQVTILQALRQRGCSVTYITCDGCFSDCDLLQASTGAPAQKPANACLFCQARVATRLAGWGMPFRWLGQWLTTQDRRTASAWVQGLKPQAYVEAQFEKWPIGEWVNSSVHRHFRHNVLDLGDTSVAMTYASYLYSGVLACVGLSRIFDEEKPNVQLLFNGRMAPTRIALELARHRGIRTICEERGYLPGRMQLYDNVNCLDFSAIGDLWRQWKTVPLKATEIDELGNLLEDRWRGRANDLTRFSEGMSETSSLRDALSLDARPIWALFPSSLDESVERDRQGEAFESQHDWIDATVDFVSRQSEVQLVIRVHPNSGSKKSLGRNPQDGAYFERLIQRLPTNVRLIPAESSISSYDLAVEAKVGLVWFSTIGLEMASLGRPVVRVGAGPLISADFLRAPTSRENYDSVLRDLSQFNATVDLTTIVQAWRFAHIFFLRRSMDFPLVRQPNWFVGEFAYNSAQALQPGHDASLDRICEMFLNGRPVHDPAEARPASLIEQERARIKQLVKPYQ